MMSLTFGVILLSLLIHGYHFLWPENWTPQQFHMYRYLIWLNLLFPVLLGVITFFLYRTNSKHPWLPFSVMLSLTFSSISMISGGEGMVVYHFSIFMVVAILAYYENIKLIYYMTALFAIQHLLGYFVPSLTLFVFGSTHYMFSMLLIHALFLVLTSGATTLQIISKKKYTSLLKNENAAKQTLISDLIKNITDTATQVLTTSEQLKLGTRESELASQHISSAIQQMAAGADEQLQKTFENQTTLNDVTQGLQDIATNSLNVAEESNRTTEQASQGHETVQATLKQIHTIHGKVNELATVIAQLDTRSTQINQIITVISSISEQTHLLALNAAIEASRAGDAGRGFAVVANEVKKLSSQTEESTAKVAQLIQDIQNDTQFAVDLIKSSTKEVSEGQRLTTQTAEVFEGILEATKQVNHNINTTSEISQKMAKHATQVTAAMEEITRVAQETASSSESISAASEEQLATMENIASIADFLNDLMKELNTLTSNLNTPASPA